VRVLWTPAALRDRADIVDYIAIENPRAALGIDELFSEAAARLADFPRIGKPGLIPGTRELLPHQSYRLVYELEEPEETVWILALVHTARQWPPVSD
jgi:addiction module RelE/StbE family toxin